MRFNETRREQVRAAARLLREQKLEAAKLFVRRIKFLMGQGQVVSGRSNERGWINLSCMIDGGNMSTTQLGFDFVVYKTRVGSKNIGLHVRNCDTGKVTWLTATDFKGESPYAVIADENVRSFDSWLAHVQRLA